MSELSFRTLAVSTFTAIALVSMSVDVLAEPLRLGSGQVSTIAFNPDGTILAAAHRTDPLSDIYANQVVILWDPETQEQLDVFDVQNTRALTFSPDGTLLASGGGDNIVRLWDVAGRNSVKAMQSLTRWGVGSLAFSPDGKTLASCGSGSTVGSTAICLWDVQTGEQTGTLRGHTGQGIGGVAFSPDGSLLFSGGARGDEAIRVWDVQTQEQVGELIGPLDATYDLAFSPDGTILASAGGWYDKAVYLWDAQTWQQIEVLAGHSAHVLSIAFSPDGRLLASTVNWDNTIHFWDIEKQKQVGVFEHHDAMDSGTPSELAFSPDGKWLACGSENGVELWRLDQPQEMLTELMLFVMSEFYLGHMDAELAWDALVYVQEALAALDSGDVEGVRAAMNDLKVLINEERAPREGRITSEATAETIQRANEIIIVVGFRE